LNDRVEWWVVFVWPVVSAALNVILRTRTPEEWVERCERSPRLAALTRLVRSVGLDPVKMVQSLGELVEGGRK
jgi:hypothetical protein